VSLRTVVGQASGQCGQVVVVDNTPVGRPGAQDILPPRPGLVLLRVGENAGLSSALNRGVRLADPGADTLLLLDQDSAIPDGLVVTLRDHLDRDGGIGIATPAPWDVDAGRYLDPLAAARPPVGDVRFAITSGMLVRRRALDDVGALRTDFFVDCVDQDLCLRMRRRGWRVVQDRRVRLPHTLGQARWHGWGPLRLRASHHPTWRLYWAARNGVVLVRENWDREPLWSAASIAHLCYWAFAIAVFEPPRRLRLATLLHGCRDGWAGRTDLRQLPGGALVPTRQ